MEPSWRTIGASVQGSSHQTHDIPCQDAHGYRVLPSGVAVIAVADGAGSAERSAEGSQCAVEQVINGVEMGLADGAPQSEAEWQTLLAESFHQARQAIVELAEKENASLPPLTSPSTSAN